MEELQNRSNLSSASQIAELQLELGGGLQVIDRSSEKETWTVQSASGRRNVIPHHLADVLIIELDG
jgi:hypothetical protein